MNFLEHITPIECGDGEFQWAPKALWNQGFGVYGGLTFATIIQAASRVSDHPVRRLSVELCAPVLEETTILKVELKRRGGKTDFLNVEVLQNDQHVALAHVTCGAPRAADLDRKPRRDLPARSGHIIGPDIPMPSFSQFFAYEPCRGHMPMSGSSDPVLKSGGWIEPRFSGPRDHSLTAAVIDAWWPAILGAARGPRPMGTMSFAMDVLNLPAEVPGPFFLEVTSGLVTDGYSIETDELWDHTGQLIARAQQNIAVIR